MSINATDLAMLTGELRPPQPRTKRRISNLGITAEGYDDLRLKTRAKNRAMYAKRQADPVKKAARAAALRKWALENAERVRAARLRWKEKNKDRYLAYQRTWRRTWQRHLTSEEKSRVAAKVNVAKRKRLASVPGALEANRAYNREYQRQRRLDPERH